MAEIDHVEIHAEYEFNLMLPTHDLRTLNLGLVIQLFCYF